MFSVCQIAKKVMPISKLLLRKTVPVKDIADLTRLLRNNPSTVSLLLLELHLSQKLITGGM